jgi:hypothetical protein
MAKFVVAVSAQSLFLAESKIIGCANCQGDQVSTRFERVLDRITGLPNTTTYILPALAICPTCYNHVFESTMVSISEKKGERRSFTKARSTSPERD